MKDEILRDGNRIQISQSPNLQSLIPSNKKSLPKGADLGHCNQVALPGLLSA